MRSKILISRRTVYSYLYVNTTLLLLYCKYTLLLMFLWFHKSGQILHNGRITLLKVTYIPKSSIPCFAHHWKIITNMGQLSNNRHPFTMRAKERKSICLAILSYLIFPYSHSFLFLPSWYCSRYLPQFEKLQRQEALYQVPGVTLNGLKSGSLLQLCCWLFSVHRVMAERCKYPQPQHPWSSNHKLLSKLTKLLL